MQARPSHLDTAWAYAAACAAGVAGGAAGDDLDSLEFREAALVAAGACLRVRAPAVKADLCQVHSFVAGHVVSV